MACSSMSLLVSWRMLSNALIVLLSTCVGYCTLMFTMAAKIWHIVGQTTNPAFHTLQMHTGLTSCAKTWGAKLQKV